MTYRAVCFVMCLGVAAATSCGIRQSRSALEGRWIDLSHSFSDETVYWPTAEPFKLETVAAGVTEKGYFYSAYQFCAAEHGGTHLDAPVHFSEGRKSVDQVDLQQLIGSAVKIDVSANALANPDYLITVDDLTKWEASNGIIPGGAIVLLYTGYSRYWPDRLKYLGTDKRGQEAVAELHFPGLHPDAARWLTGNRRIKAVGLDTASIDYGQSQLFESHQILAGQETPIFENVANLDQFAGDRRHGRGAADEDQGRQRRPPANRRAGAGIASIAERKTIMTQRIFTSIVLSALLISQSVVGQQPADKKEELIRELLAVTETRSSGGKIVDSILTEFSKQYPAMIEGLADAEPDLTPAQRERVKSAIAESYERVSKSFRERLPQRIDIGQVIEEISYSLYDKYFTEEEIRDLISFYKTSTGKKSLSILPQLFAESIRLAGEKLSPVLNRLVTEIVAEEKERMKRLK